MEAINSLPLPEGQRLSLEQMQALVENKPFTTGDTEAPVPTVPVNHKVEMPTPIPVDQLPKDKQEKIAADLKVASEFMAQANIPVVEAPKPEPEVKEDPTPSLAPERCPRCGLNPKESDLEVAAAEDRKEWIRAVIGDTRFYKSYPLLKGALVVRFKTRTIEESDSIQVAMSKIVAADTRIGVAALQDVMYKQNQLQMSASLDFISVNSVTDNFADKVGTDKFQGWSEQKMQLVLAAFYQFERLVQTLLNHAMDDSFWSTGVGND